MPHNNALRREVINSRPSFMTKPRPSWRSNLAVLLLVLGLGQFAVYLAHLLWLGELWVVALFWRL